jgi:hypothetical protein
MHPRANRLRATSYALVAIVLLSLPAGARPAFAADKKDQKKEQKKEDASTVVKYVAHKEKVPYQGKLVMVLGVEPLEGGRTMELVVKNQDMNKKEYNPVLNTDNVNALQKGDPIKIRLDDSRPKPMVTYLKKYDLKPGEENPKTFVFENFFQQGEGRQAYTAVVLSKFDEFKTVAVPQKKTKEGQAEPDAEIGALLPELKTGDVVEAEIRNGQPVPVLVSLERYSPPQTGKFLKLVEEDVAEGQKGSAVEIDQGGKTVKALVQGKLQGKKWVTDGKVLAAARKLKPEAEVVYRTRTEGEKLWLKEIEPAPKPRDKEVAKGRDRDRDRDMDRDKDKEKATDGPGERRGRRPRPASK